VTIDESSIFSERTAIYLKVANMPAPFPVAQVALGDMMSRLTQETVGPQMVFGVNGANSCPESFSKITSWPLCLASLHILGPGNPDTDANAIASYEFDSVENESDWPSGCYRTSYGVWFNEHPTGSTNPEAAPICAQDMEPVVVTGGVLWIGDSDTDYWEHTGSIAPGSYNVAVGGYTCEDVLNDLDTMMEIFAPSTIIMTCGENDLPDATVDETFSRFSTIVDKVVAIGGSTLIAFGTKDEPATSELWQKYADYDSRIMALAESLSTNIASEPSLVFVDVNAGFKAIGNPSSLYAGDGLHLSSEGYALWDTWASLALAGVEGNASCAIWRTSGDDCVLSLEDTPSAPVNTEQPSSSPVAEPIPSTSASSAVVGISSFLTIAAIAIMGTH
jgi:hypothetical protein